MVAVSGDGSDAALSLTSAGAELLTTWGLDLASIGEGRRPFCRACLDWTERRPHIAGALGSAILDQLLDRKWLSRTESRILIVSRKGAAGFERVFGIRADELARLP